MWGTSHNRINPWRLFRCSATADNHVEQNAPNKQKTKRTSARRSAENFSTSQQTDDILYEQHNGNANANILDKFKFYGLKNKSTCDKQTQTDSFTEMSTRQEIDRRSPAKKIIYSKSCESVVKNPIIQPCSSRSFDNSYRKSKCQIDDRQTTVKLNDNLKMVRSDDDFSSEKHSRSFVFPKDISLTDGFYGGKIYDSSSDKHGQYMSQNEQGEEVFSQVSNHIENPFSKQFSDEEFCSDLELNLSSMPCQDKTENTFKNQWSPFHQHLEKAPLFYGYRQPDEVSLVSERSCYSTTSEEVEDDYEIVDWSRYNDSYKESENNTKQRSDTINSPLTTPVIDLSALDGYHTAPNSPNNAREQWQSYSEEYCPRPYHDKDAIFEYSDNYKTSNRNRRSSEIKHAGYQSKLGVQTNYQSADNAYQSQTLCSKCGQSIEASQVQFQSGIIENETNDFNNQHEQERRIQRPTKVDLSNLKLDTPPFISVSSLHYEADPETGKAKVVGRGSFGQVYKARFSDPMYNQLPIVIKEFDEEFTNCKEIIEEAKRLNYLQDTGYVPICYGLLCFGSPIQPKYGIVQEYVGTGLTLEQMLWDQYELPLEFWLRIAVQCCEGLARFHDKGILLNDIKTNNILIEFAEHSVRIRYIDFGLATDMRGKRYKNTRSLEDFVYLAPEVRKQGEITTVASDIYSLGFILEQIKKYTGVNELTVIARLLMDKNPDARLPPREAASLLKKHMVKIGYDPMFSWEI